MNKTINLKPYLPILLLVVLVLFMPTEVAFANVIHDFFYGIVTTVFGWLVGLGAVVLNYGINEYIVEFGANYSTSGVGATIERLWATFRDLFNLTFIFGLVYVGFKMILRSDDSNTRKWLINIIIAALLVNFSLFITKFVIDFSNILAVEIMNLSSGVTAPGGAPAPGTIFPIVNGTVDLSGAMQNATGIVTVNNTQTGAITVQKLPENSGFKYIFGTMFLYIVTAFVFFSAGILLIIRGVVLLVLMVVSPFLFLGMVLPFFRNLSSRLWGVLFSRAFMAPIYVAILYISMSVAYSLVGNGGDFTAAMGSDSAAAVSNTANAFGPFIVVIALLLMSLSIAQKLGVEGASTMVKMGNSIQRYGRRQVAKGAGGMALRRVNWASEKAGRGYDRMGSTRAGRFARTAASVATLGVASKKNVRGVLAAGQKASVAGSETLDQKRQRQQAERAASTQVATEARSRRTATDETATQNERATAVQRMSNEEFSRLNQAQRQELAQFMTEAQINSMETQGIVNADEANNLREQRETDQFANFEQTFDNLDASAGQFENALRGYAQAVENMTPERLRQLGQTDEGRDRLTDRQFARNLTDDQMDTLRDSLDADDFNAVREARTAGQVAHAQTGQATVGQVGTPLTSTAYRNQETIQAGERNRSRLLQNPQRAGEQPAEVFQEQSMAQYITPQAVDQRMRNGISDADLQGIRDNIQNYIDDPQATPQERVQRQRVWRRWSENSNFGGRLGLNIEAEQNQNQAQAQPQQNQQPEGIREKLRRKREENNR